MLCINHDISCVYVNLLEYINISEYELKNKDKYIPRQLYVRNNIHSIDSYIIVCSNTY